MGAYDNTVLVMMADGFEEIEALTVVDLLRRAGIDVKMVSIYGNNNDRDDKYVVKGARGISVVTDTCIDDSFIVDVFGSDVPLFVLPGGMPGTTNLKNDKNVETLIMDQFNKGRYVAAICAAPSIYSHLGLLKDKRATSHGSFEKEMDCKEYGGSVVTDGQFVTANGLGSALEMGLEMVSILDSKEKAESIAKAIHFNR